MGNAPARRRAYSHRSGAANAARSTEHAPRLAIIDDIVIVTPRSDFSRVEGDLQMTRSMLRVATALALASVSAAGSAALITYDVDQTIGLGSVVGSIQTNGTLGVLGHSDIVGFNLIISGPGASVNLTQANSVFVSEGINLSATASNLLFNYSGPSGFALFQQGSFGTGQKYYCNASVAGTCFQGASAIPESFSSPSAQVEPRAGLQTIGMVAAVPEPATWAMMIGGFGLVGGAVRRQRRIAARVTYA